MSSQDTEEPTTAPNTPEKDGFKTPTDTNPQRHIELQRASAQAYMHGVEVGTADGAFIGALAGATVTLLVCGIVYFAVLRTSTSSDDGDDA